MATEITNIDRYRTAAMQQRPFVQAPATMVMGPSPMGQVQPAIMTDMMYRLQPGDNFGRPVVNQFDTKDIKRPLGTGKFDPNATAPVINDRGPLLIGAAPVGDAMYRPGPTDNFGMPLAGLPAFREDGTAVGTFPGGAPVTSNLPPGLSGVYGGPANTFPGLQAVQAQGSPTATQAMLQTIQASRPLLGANVFPSPYQQMARPMPQPVTQQMARPMPQPVMQPPVMQPPVMQQMAPAQQAVQAGIGSLPFYSMGQGGRGINQNPAVSAPTQMAAPYAQMTSGMSAPTQPAQQNMGSTQAFAGPRGVM